jgi:hypothetical protein
MTDKLFFDTDCISSFLWVEEIGHIINGDIEDKLIDYDFQHLLN